MTIEPNPRLTHAELRHTGHVVAYSPKHDANFCETCDQWTEEKCEEKGCEFCKDRPERPSEER